MALRRLARLSVIFGLGVVMGVLLPLTASAQGQRSSLPPRFLRVLSFGGTDGAVNVGVCTDELPGLYFFDVGNATGDNWIDDAAPVVTIGSRYLNYTHFAENVPRLCASFPLGEGRREVPVVVVSPDGETFDAVYGRAATDTQPFDYATLPPFAFTQPGTRQLVVGGNYTAEIRVRATSDPFLISHSVFYAAAGFAPNEEVVIAIMSTTGDYLEYVDYRIQTDENGTLNFRLPYGVEGPMALVSQNRIGLVNWGEDGAQYASQFARETGEPLDTTTLLNELYAHYWQQPDNLPPLNLQLTSDTPEVIITETTSVWSRPDVRNGVPVATLLSNDRVRLMGEPEEGAINLAGDDIGGWYQVLLPGRTEPTGWVWTGVFTFATEDAGEAEIVYACSGSALRTWADVPTSVEANTDPTQTGDGSLSLQAGEIVEITSARQVNPTQLQNLVGVPPWWYQVRKPGESATGWVQDFNLTLLDADTPTAAGCGVG